MRRSAHWPVFAMLSWILWMDQSVYTRSGHGHTATGGEGASSGWQQLAVVPTKAACEELRRERIQDATRKADPAKRGRYPDRFRFFCSPVDEDTNTR